MMLAAGRPSSVIRRLTVPSVVSRVVPADKLMDEVTAAARQICDFSLPALMMVKEFFVRAGWHVIGGPGIPAADILARVGSEWFDCIGVSVGSDVHLEGLADWLLAIRKASKNAAIAVLLGGPRFVEQPELAVLLGADATAADARDAVRQAERLAAR